MWRRGGRGAGVGRRRGRIGGGIELVYVASGASDDVRCGEGRRVILVAGCFVGLLSGLEVVRYLTWNSHFDILLSFS